MGKPVTATAAVLIVLVHFVAFMGVLVLGSAFSDEEMVAVPFRAAAYVVAPLAALYFGLIRHAPTELTLGALRMGRPTRAQWTAIGLAIVCGAALAPVVLSIYEWMISLIPLDEAEKPEVLTGADLAILAGAQLISAAVLEAVFRGLLQPRLGEQLGVRRALWVTVLVFVVAQVTAITIPVALLMGAVCGIVALASGTTWTSIATVVAMNACLIFLPDGQPPVAWTAGGLVVAALALWLSWRQRVAR